MYSRILHTYYVLCLSYSVIRKSLPDDISRKRRRLVLKQGSLCAYKIIAIKITQIYFLSIYLHIFIFFFMNLIDRQTDDTAFAAIFGQIDTSEYYDAYELEGLGTFLLNTLYIKPILLNCHLVLLYKIGCQSLNVHVHTYNIRYWGFH